MKVKRTNLNDQLMNFNFQQSQTTPSKKSSPSIVIHYDQIIQKQSSIIQSLYRQCTALRQKINRIKSQQIFNSQHKLLPQNNMEKFAQMVQNALLKEIGTLLQIQQSEISRNKVLQTIKRIKWQRQKKSQPIFIERKKQVRVPVPVQIIVEKPVQKIIVQEKIVIQQRIVEVPVFRQKIVQKFVSKIEQTDQLLSTISKLSQQDSKKQISSGLQKSQQSLFLGTNSVLKQDSKQKPAKQESKIKIQNNKQKSEINYRQRKNSQKYQNHKNLTLSDLRQQQANMNRTYFYQNNNQSSKIHYNSRGSKNNMKSPKYYKDDYRDNYKYNYNEEQNYNYNQRNYDRQRNDRTYYGNSRDNNRTVVSPRSNNQDKYRDQIDKYTFDKNKFIDSSKMNNNKNIKRRDKYDFNDKYRDK